MQANIHTDKPLSEIPNANVHPEHATQHNHNLVNKQLPVIDANEARTLRLKKLDEFVCDKIAKLSSKIRMDAAEGYGQVAVDVSEWLDPVYLLVAQAFRKQNFHVHFEDKEGQPTDDEDPSGCKLIIDWDTIRIHHP